MTMLFVIGLLVLAAAAVLLVRVVAFPHLRVVAQVEQIHRYGFATHVIDVESRQSGPSALTVLAERIGRRAAARIGSLRPITRSELMGAGIYAPSEEAIHGYRVVAAFGLPAFIFLARLASGSMSFMTIVLVIAIAAITWLLPAAVIRTRAQRRLDRVDRALPELIDVLTATIEAGLGFAGSLQLCAERFDGPMGQELRLMLQEQAMGLSTDAALANLLKRCDTLSVRAFVRAVTQGESLGVSVGQMMRNLASDARKRRRSNAQERVQKAPVKMLFPLVFLIFPALLLVLLYPAAHEIVTHIS
jgi:tight adherence protein C